MLIILSAPSGCGKSSIAQALIALDHNIKLSISATTRKPRIGEIEGKHYFFKTETEFLALNLLEYTTIYDNMYGTPREYVEDTIAQGNDILFDIDFHGGHQIKISSLTTESKAVSIFLVPPTLAELKARLIKRAQDSLSAIETRMAAAADEMSYAQYYDYTIVNDDFNQTVEQIISIIASERKLKQIALSYLD